MINPKKIVIIAGPNGAGKTTFALEYLPNEAGCPHFINADLIALGLSPFQPEKAALRAGRIMLHEIKSNIQQENSFAFETTLSGILYAKQIPDWQQQGYIVKLIYLSLPTVEMAIARVASRVAHGGHAIPEDIIRHRYITGWNNLNTIYKTIVNQWILYDNSDECPRIVDQRQNP